ncbi:RHS repeat-associated core domain-containing protein [Fontisubflavum oceani]|uniref:RHS repeat-associated core domain-containing protein n=1 Tax=Fontisubflavum oceani TaxID=2978973 RepID=UPI0025B3498A|nr:RHS repeat-associated core domain-containing protein [Fontisubflavum oceani]WJY20396.1 RHS repeat-associated core domain-containing protein [Fontisubflavum oceani]
MDFIDGNPHYFSFGTLFGSTEQELERIRSLAAGDVNGDGAADLVVSYGTPGQDLTIRVALSDGAGFITPRIWGDSSSIPELNQGRRISVGQPLKYPSYVAMRDVNGDGRADLILTDRIDESTGTLVRVHVDHDRDYNRFTGPQDLRDLFMMSYVYLSTGDGFVPAGPEQTSELLGVHGWGDINGDGIEDAIARNSPGVILYGTGDVPHLLTSIRDGFGGVTGIEYVPSTAVGNNDNDVPGVTQLVAAIERQDGRGNTRRTSYSYVGSRYDYAHRRPLGYRTITAHLPAIAGEAEGPQVVTTYLNDHLGERGRMASQTILHDGQTQRQVINAWDVRAPDLRPFRAQQTSERTRVRYGADLVETTRLFEHTRYGQVSLEVTLGFTVNGVDQDPDDNQLIRTGRAFNLSDYIVDQPGWRIAQSGSTFDAEDRARWLWREFYTHEGNADPFTAPSNSNVVRVERWTGDVSSCCARRLEEERSYDAHGNVLSQTDARGHTTTYTYDTARHLFRLSETNALGHVATTTWDTACQAPVRVTDVNGQVTDYTYDSHCRETRVDHPNGNWETTAYLNWGDPEQAFIQTQAPSGSSAPGAGISEHRQYVDGFGQTYRSRTTTMLEGELDFIFIDRAFDARGNLAWESIPPSSPPPPSLELLLFPPSSLNPRPPPIAASQRTSFVYDPLNRLTNTTAADGTLSATVFGAQSIGGIMHPLVTSHDAHCFDGDSSTICGEIRLTLDSRGNTIARAMTDADQTDIDASGTERTTSYTYDLRNQLIGVTDPIGATWAYTYDVFGNRTVSDDPALGRWTMVYDANGNLTRQTDAEGQVIAITYDALNRVTRRDVTTSGGTTTTTSTYDEAAAGEHNIGQLTTLSNPDHTIRYGYDAVGQQIRAEHSFLGRSYTLETEYRPSGAVLRQHLPTTPGSTATAPAGDYSYDVAGRLNGFGTYIEAIAYNAWGNPTLIDYGNTLEDLRLYDTQRGWLTDIVILDTLDTAFLRDHSDYTRSATGRISRVDSQTPAGDMNYSYDYAGRLLTATNYAGQPAQNRVFTYDAAGSLRSNSQIGSYSYGPATGPHPHAPIAVAGQSFTYDANGNMTTSLPLTTGLAGRMMSYDGENRPLSVTHGGATTTYTYGADGTRLLRTDPSGNITATFGPVEIRNFGSPAEQVLTYPHPDIRITNGTEVTYLHRDHLNSVVAMTDATGARAEARVYAPFGEIAWRDGGTSPDETFGYIGERYDSDAGLQYLNARYYDPRLAMFIQPDWFEVTEPGVGTNRYAYSANDPINHMDPEGNAYSRSDRAQEVLDNYLEHSEEFGHARDQFGSVGSGVSGTIAAKNRAAGLSGRFTFDARGNWTSSVRGGLDVTVSTNGGRPPGATIYPNSPRGASAGAQYYYPGPPSSPHGLGHASGRPLLQNTRPGDAILLQSTPRQLISVGGRFYLQSSRGLRTTPSGTYNFVTTPGGRILVARQNTSPNMSTHLGLSGGRDVRYGGTISFPHRHSANRGAINHWDNASGHYRPPARLAPNAGLPMQSFRPF